MKVDKHVMRGVNRSNILRCVLKEGAINQSAIAREVDLSIPSVMKIVDELVEEGILRRAGKGKSSGGKRPDLLELVEDAYYIIGVDMGRTAIRVALCNLRGDICDCAELPTGNTNPVEQLVDRTAGLIIRLIEDSRIPQEKLLGVGVAMPGLIDEERGNVILSPDFSWENIPLLELLKVRLNMTVKMENANLSLARAEDRKGAGKESNFFLCVNLGHGIGAGLLLDGHPYKGCSGTAGELGHMVVEPNGPLCACGNRGCLEAMASGEAIRQQAVHMLQRGISSKMMDIVQGDLTKVTGKIVFEAAAEGDIGAQAIVSKAAEYLGIALANCVNLLNPDRIVLCGGLTRNGEKFLQQIKNHMNSRCMRGLKADVKIRIGMLGEYAAAFGATLQYIDEFFVLGGYFNEM